MVVLVVLVVLVALELVLVPLRFGVAIGVVVGVVFGLVVPWCFAAVGGMVTSRLPPCRSVLNVRTSSRATRCTSSEEKLSGPKSSAGPRCGWYSCRVPRITASGGDGGGIADDEDEAEADEEQEVQQLPRRRSDCCCCCG